MRSRAHEYVRRHHWGMIATFLVLSSGTAYALEGSNTVFTDDIVDGHVRTADIGTGHVRNPDLGASAVTSNKIADGTVRGVDVLDNSLTGTDINEGTLEVLAGSWNATPSDCNPESSAFTNCPLSTSITVPPGSDTLVLTSLRWHSDTGGAQGQCWVRVDSELMPPPFSTTTFGETTDTTDDSHAAEHTFFVVKELTPGEHSLDLACAELESDIQITELGIAAFRID